MKGRVSKPRACRSDLKLTKAPQEKQLDTIASKTLELPPDCGGRSPAGGGVAQDTTRLRSSKRPLDPASTNDSSPAKRARLTRTDIHRGPSLRRSARLETRRRSKGSEDPARLVQSAPPREPQADTGAGGDSLPSKRARSRTNIQQSKVENKATAEKPMPPKRLSTSAPEPKLQGHEQISPATSLRKRQIDSGGGDDNDHQPERPQLTQENLAKLNNKMPKKGTREAPASAPSEFTTGSTLTKTTTKTTSTTTSGFADQAYKNGILDPISSKPPTNLEDIRRRYAQPRRTASPTESVYEDYIYDVGSAVNESTMVVEVSGQLLKKYSRGYQRAFNQAFTAFPKDVGFNDSLSAPQPDFVEGIEKQEFRPFPISEHVKGGVLYKDNPHSVTLPHIAGEWKGPGKDMAEARLQSAYDGAALVYARNQALSYLGKSDPLGHAEVTTFTTDGTNLNLYAHYAAPSADGMLEYHQYPIKSTNLIDSHQGLRDGRRGLRNEQDYARKRSYAIRDQLKEHWKQRSSALHPSAEGASLPVADGTFGETNADETDYVVVEQPCQSTPAAASSIKLSKSALPVDDSISCSSGQKRKVSSSQRPSRGSSKPKAKAQEYWKWDAKRRQYFHRHSDGKVAWLEDSDDEK